MLQILCKDREIVCGFKLELEDPRALYFATHLMSRIVGLISIKRFKMFLINVQPGPLCNDESLDEQSSTRTM